MLWWAKRIHICVICLWLLASNFSRWLLPLGGFYLYLDLFIFKIAHASISLSFVLNGSCLYLGVHAQFQEDMYSNSMVFVYGIKYSRGRCLHIQFSKDMRTTIMMVGYSQPFLWKTHLRGFPNMLGIFLVVSRFLTHWGVFLVIYHSPGSFLDDSDSLGSFLDDSDSQGSFLNDSGAL